MDGATLTSTAYEAVYAQAVAYGKAVYFAQSDVFEAMCHDQFSMSLINADGTTQHWDKNGYLERVKGRSAFPGGASYKILSVDVAGDEIARVHILVDVPPARYEDHLGFVKADGSWKLLTKVFRTAALLGADG